MADQIHIITRLHAPKVFWEEKQIGRSKAQNLYRNIKQKLSLSVNSSMKIGDFIVEVPIKVRAVLLKNRLRDNRTLYQIKVSVFSKILRGEDN